MADTNTTSTTAEPLQHTEAKQPEIINGADPNRNAVTLKGLDIKQQLSKFKEIASESEKIGEYFQFKYGGAILTASPTFKKAFDDNQLYSVRLSPTLFGRTVPDPNNEGMSKVVQAQGWSLDAFMTIDDMKAAAENMKAARDIEFSILREDVLAEKKIEAFKAADLSKFITDADMEAMFAKA